LELREKRRDSCEEHHRTAREQLERALSENVDDSGEWHTGRL
jgi:hypothetical protein